MKRKKFERQLEFESLEAMVLLSGVSGLAHSGTALLAGTNASSGSTIVLSGGEQGIYSTGKAPGSPTTFSTTGSLSPLGKTSIKGSINLTVAKPTGSAKFKAKHGTLAVTFTQGPTKDRYVYAIESGTGAYSGATGSGRVFITFTAKANDPAHGKLTLTFLLPP